MDNLHHRAGQGLPMAKLCNGRELDHNLCTAEMAGGLEDIRAQCKQQEKVFLPRCPG